MYKIDLAMKGLSDQIEALSKRGTIAQINAEYSDVGYFTATSESITDYTNGMVISLSLNQTNQGTVGLNINEIGTVQIVYATPEGQLQDITAGMMKQNSVYFCVYNGTYWVLSSAGYASTSNNVSDTINGKNITDIFETDGTTAKNATLQEQAKKLQTPVSIGLSGVTATAQQFDGSQGITIPITEVPGQIVTDVVMRVNGIEPQSGNVELQATDVNAVATINGISPSDGNVQLSASDIGAAPSSNGISTYTCTTTGTTHSLTGTGNNIKFVADAPFNEGDTITVNGSLVSAYTQDGEALTGGAWNTSMTVVCYLDGSTLNFKGGGGKVTVTGLSAEVLLTGITAKVLQGAKEIVSVDGILEPLFWGGSFGTPSSASQNFNFADIDGNFYASNQVFTLKRTPIMAVVKIEGAGLTTGVYVGDKYVSKQGFYVVTNITGNTIRIENADASARFMIVAIG